jgi:hypothetical protein
MINIVLKVLIGYILKTYIKLKMSVLRGIKIKDNIIVDKYKAEIVDLYSFIKFPLEYSFKNEEFTDYNAIRAYKKRAAGFI